MVSILVPVYNAAPYLRKCVGSTTGQTYTDLQIVLINDGSTDGSWSIMQELAREDSRIEIYTQANRGVAATRNNLLERAKGDFVLFVDSDDWIDNVTIDYLLKDFASNESDIVTFQMTNIREDICGTYSRERIIALFLEHASFNGSLCNKLIKRTLFNGLRFDETVSYGEDALMIWQVLQRVKCVSIIKNIFYHIGINSNSLSRKHLSNNKFSVYTVWNSICEDVDVDWPQYSQLAHARFACEMTLILRDAVKSGYRDKNYIRPLQDVIRRDGRYITQTGISSRAMRAFAWLVSHNYWLACRISRFVW